MTAHYICDACGTEIERDQNGRTVTLTVTSDYRHHLHPTENCIDAWLVRIRIPRPGNVA